MRLVILALLLLPSVVHADACSGNDWFAVRVILDQKPIDPALKEKIVDVACNEPVIVTRRSACSNNPDVVSATCNSLNCTIDANCPGGVCLKKMLIDIMFSNKTQVQKFMDCMSGDTGISPLCTVTYSPVLVRLTRGIEGTNETDVIYNLANKNRYKRIMPDECDTWTESTCTSCHRPATARDLHIFAGSPIKDLETLDQ